MRNSPKLSRRVAGQWTPSTKTLGGHIPPLKGLFVNTVSFPIENEFTLSNNIFFERGKPPFFFCRNHYFKCIQSCRTVLFEYRIETKCGASFFLNNFIYVVNCILLVFTFMSWYENETMELEQMLIVLHNFKNIILKTIAERLERKNLGSWHESNVLKTEHFDH